jgi:Ring finger domain
MNIKKIEIRYCAINKSTISKMNASQQNSDYIINNDLVAYYRALSQNYDDIGRFSEEVRNNLVNNRIIPNDLIIQESVIEDMYATRNVPDSYYNHYYENYFNRFNNLILNELIRNNPIPEPVPNPELIEAMEIDDPEPEPNPEPQEEDILPPLAVPTRPTLTPESLLEELAHPCSICYRPMELNNLTLTRCGHIFHFTCLETSFDYSTGCPQCRTTLVQHMH